MTGTHTLDTHAGKERPNTDEIMLSEDFSDFSLVIESAHLFKSEKKEDVFCDYLLRGYEQYRTIEECLKTAPAKVLRAFDYIDAIKDALTSTLVDLSGYIRINESSPLYDSKCEEVWKCYRACLGVGLEVFPSEIVSFLEMIRNDMEKDQSEMKYETAIPHLAFMVPQSVTRKLDDFNWTYVILGGLIRMFARSIGVDAKYRVVLDKTKDRVKVIAMKHLCVASLNGIDVYDYDGPWSPTYEIWSFNTSDGRCVNLEFPVGKHSERKLFIGDPCWSPSSKQWDEPFPMRNRSAWFKLFEDFCRNWVSFQYPYLPGFRALARRLRLRCPTVYER